MNQVFRFPFGTPPQRPIVNNGKRKGATLFGHRYGIVAIDEAARLRNLGRHWTALHELLRLAQTPIAMTATPVHNGPMVGCLDNLLVSLF